VSCINAVSQDRQPSIPNQPRSKSLHPLKLQTSSVSGPISNGPLGIIQLIEVHSAVELLSRTLDHYITPLYQITL